ncbi:MAG: hypothetical protein WDA68_01545 [Phycisphaerae bacterium]
MKTPSHLHDWAFVLIVDLVFYAAGSILLVTGNLFWPINYRFGPKPLKASA